MKILQIHNSYREPGGEDAVVVSEAELLRGAGHEVLQHQVRNPSSRWETLGPLALAPWNLASARRIRAVAVSARPDVAHVHNTWFSLSPAILRALRDQGVPVVLTLHNYRLLCPNALLFRDGEPCELCVQSHPWHGVLHSCYRGSPALSAMAAATIALNRALGTWERNVDVFLVLTEFARDLFVRGGLPEERIVVKANAVPDPGPRASAPSTSRTVLYVGRLSEDKGVLRLLDAWKDAAVDGLELLLVGDGPLQHQVADCVSARVRLAGRLKPGAVRDLMLSSRALLFPSPWYEGQPMVILEALAAGLPVLASSRGGTAETLRAVGPEWLVEPYDRPTWLAGLARLNDDQTADAVGRRARAAYERAFTPEHSLEGLEYAYRRAVERRASR